MVEKDYNFEIPQRLEPLGYIINIGKNLVILIRAFFFMLVIAFYKGYYLELIPQLIFSAIILVLVSRWYLQFNNYRYYVDDEKRQILLEEGVFSKQKTVVKYANILQIQISQNTLQRLFNLYSLTIDTSGKGEVEIDLYALNEDRALQLKAHLLSKMGGGATASTPTLGSEQFKYISLSSINILLVSLFANYRQGLALFIGFCVTFFNTISDFIKNFNLEDKVGDYEGRLLGLGNSILFISFGLLIVVLIPFVINFFRYYLKYYDFNIVKNINHTFSMTYGLTKKVNTIFNRDRIQVFVFQQNKIMKKLGIGILNIHQIVSDENNVDQASILMPGLTLTDKAKVYDLAFEKEVDRNSQCHTPHIGLFIARLIPINLFILVVSILIYHFFLREYLLYLGGGAFVLIILNVVYQYLYYRSKRLYWNGEFLVERYGVWTEKEVIIPADKIIKVSVSQSFFQKRRRVSNLLVFTAGASFAFKFLPEHTTNQLSNHILCLIEK